MEGWVDLGRQETYIGDNPRGITRRKTRVSDQHAVDIAIHMNARDDRSLYVAVTGSSLPGIITVNTSATEHNNGNN